MNNIQTHICSEIKRSLLEESYRTSLLENSELKNVWMKRFNDVVKKKNPAVTNSPDYWDAANQLYTQGIPAVDAAERMFLKKPQGNPMPRDFSRGTGGWQHI